MGKIDKEIDQKHDIKDSKKQRDEYYQIKDEVHIQTYKIGKEIEGLHAKLTMLDIRERSLVEEMKLK
jgi:hypothetical protein